jgi:hypothetical protein
MASPAWVVALVCRRRATSAGLVIARRGRQARQVGEYAAGELVRHEGGESAAGTASTRQAGVRAPREG